MDAAARDLLRRLGEEGTRRFSHWDATLFTSYCQTVFPAVWNSLSYGRERTFEGLATLVHQGIGEGYLKGDPEVAPVTFLDFCIRDWLPDVLAGLPPAEHVPLLARVWNLAEGLLGEPEWVNGYVMSRIGDLRGDARPEAVLIDILRPLLETAPAARWEAPYSVTLLSLRQTDDEFLPGELQLAAPLVLVVTDRRRPVRLGIHLRRRGQSQIVGTFGPTAAIPDEPTAVDVAWNGGIARIGGESVPLPFLAGPFRWALVRASYLVVSAVDSQKLWIIESAA